MAKSDLRIHSESEWSFSQLEQICEEAGVIARDELGLDTYPNQIEIITSEQMLDAYASIGLPTYYNHWSFGKHQVRDTQLYQRGAQGLAYEIVINSSPCISYCMEENSIVMQALVIAHAAYGHNHFFKNNAMFKEWTDATSIIDYLTFARDYIRKCEESEGRENIERFLDSCHALMNYGINRYKKPKKLSPVKERKRAEMRDQHKAEQVHHLWDALIKQAEENPAEAKPFPAEPEENILYICEKYGDISDNKREIIRIVRKISQYFYPQGQTKVMNEGCATYVHYEIMSRLHDKGILTDGGWLEFLTSHTNVVFQPGFDDRRYSGGLNPYAIGFAIMKDIERICKAPTKEDENWFPEFAGSGDHMAVLRDAWANYRDESFVRQFLSPKVIRDFKLFRMDDVKNDSFYHVRDIHDDRGYDNIRNVLGDNYERQSFVPQIEVVKIDPKTRHLDLRYTKYRDRNLGKIASMVKHVETLWGNTVYLRDENGQLLG